MKKILLLNIAILVVIFSGAQDCVNTNQFPANTIAIGHYCGLQTVVNGQFAGYFTNIALTGAMPGDQYVFSSSIATDYLTLRDAAGNVLVSGVAPITFTQPGIVITAARLHINTNSACGVQGSARNISVNLLNNCPPPSVNDECANAAPIAVNTGNTCNYTLSNSTINATQSLPGCIGSADDDVWFSFTATSTIHKFVANTAGIGGIVSPVVELFSGNCAAPLSIRCNAATSAVNNTFIQTGLTIGATYFLRVYSNAATGRGLFNICITTPVVLNDECAGAIAIPVINNNVCTSPTAASTLDATQSQPGCSGTADDDVWFSFSATSATQQIEVNSSEIAGISNPVVELFSGTCGSLTSLKCSTPATAANNRFTQTGLTIGAIYFIRVYSNAATAASQGGFSICVTGILPANDNCAEAIALIPDAGSACSNVTIGDNTGATQSQVPCGNTTQPVADVWYSFVAIAQTHKITVAFRAIDASGFGGLQMPVVQLFSGSCGSLTSIACSPATGGTNIVLQGGLVVGSTYFVRLYGGMPSSATGGYSICVTSPSVANDNCAGALPISVNNNATCTNFSSGNTTDATRSLPNTCGNGADDDVWFSFVASATTHKVLVTPSATGGIQFPDIELYSGNCGGLVSLNCKTASGAGSNFLSQNGLVVGNTYFVRVSSTSQSNDHRGAFSICVNVANPPNDECGHAIPLTVNVGAGCITTTSGTTLDATVSQPSCSGSYDIDVWYSFVATSAAHKIVVNAVNMSPLVELFSGTCGNLVSVSCNTSVLANVNSFVQGGLTPGNKYFIRVYGLSSQPATNGAFTVCVATPAVVNDECGKAENLTVNIDNTCNVTTAGTTVDASQSQPACSGTADDDVWYRFTATSATHKIFVQAASTGGINIPYVELFSGSCDNLVSIKCNGQTDISANNIIISSLTVGVQYFIRVYSQGYLPSDQGAFSICVSVPSVPNDDCAGAIPLTVNTNNVCANIVNGNTTDATESQPGCNGTNASDDIWYRFVAIATSHTIAVNSAAGNGITSPVVELFSGSCGNLVSIACTPSTDGIAAKLTQAGLTIGTTYYVRVHNRYNGARGAFAICISTPTVPNDECVGAIALTVNNGNTCNSTTIGSTAGATQSQAGCGGTADDDVWFSFVASAATHRVVVQTTATGGIVSPAVQIFSGTCASLTSVSCNPDFNNTTNSFMLPGLTAGTTYFVRVYSTGSTANTQGAFSICVNTPTAPANDNCAGAVLITVNKNGTCASVADGSTVNATQSQAACNGTADDDVWYSFVATDAGQRITVLSSASGGIQTPVIELFSGDCASLTSLACKFQTATTAVVEQAGLTIGSTYFVRVHSLSASVTTHGSFTICVSNIAVPNDNCDGAILLIPNATNALCANGTSGSTLFATESQAGCNGTADDDVWYQFVAASTSHVVNLNVSGFGGGIRNPVMEVLSGNCGALVSNACVAGTTATLNNLVPGTTYFVRIYSSGAGKAERGNFDICINTIVAGEACASAVELLPSVGQMPSYIGGNTNIASNTFTQTACGSRAFINDNVWYRFTVTNIHNVVKVLPTQSKANIYTSVFRGTCAAAASMVCSSRDTAISLTDFVVGENIFILVHSNGNPARGTFNIGVITDAPANNECTAAAPLVIAYNSNAASIFSTTRGATQSMPPCSGPVANDVWFSVTAGTDSFAIEIDNLKKDNISSQLFTGTCGSLIPIVCQTANNIITISNPVFGQQYFLRLYSSSGNPVAYFIKAYKKEATQSNLTLPTGCLFANQTLNPGFESFDVCPPSFVPTAVAGSDIIPNWSFPTNGTSDYFNSCSEFNANVEVPGNSCLGKQSPKSGQGFAGFFTLSNNNYREYLQGRLPEPLVVGKRYLVSYYVNLSDNSESGINKLGMFFSTTKTAVNTFSNLPFVPQLVSPAGQFFDDKENWVNVSAIFMADKAYQFFSIGNFNNNANTTSVPTLYDTLIVNQTAGCISSNESYLNIDDISISEINEAAIANNCNVALPLTLSDFDVVKQGTMSLVYWKTVYESSTSNFEIERSGDGSNFYKIGTVKAGIHTGSTIRNYTFTDAKPLDRVNFYRLKMVDAGGGFTYSDIRRVNFDRNTVITVFPNPVTDMLTLTGFADNGIIKLFSADGRLLLQQKVTGTTCYIKMGMYAKGTYLLQYHGMDEISNRKIIKQ